MLSLTDTQLLGWITSFLLPLFRTLGLIMVAPILSNRSMPVRFKIALAVVVTLPLAGASPPPPGLDIASAEGGLLVAREMAIGWLIGFSARLCFAAFEIAGEVIGLQMGLSFAGFFDPGSGHSNAVGRLLNTFAQLSFVAMNGPLVLIAALAHSLQRFPIGRLAFEWRNFDLIQAGAELMATGLAIALPFMILMLFLNLVLGTIARVAPQFNVFSVGFPVTVGAGLAMLASGMPLFEAPLTRAVERLLESLGP